MVRWPSGVAGAPQSRGEGQTQKTTPRTGQQENGDLGPTHVARASARHRNEPLSRASTAFRRRAPPQGSGRGHGPAGAPSWPGGPSAGDPLRPPGLTGAWESTEPLSAAKSAAVRFGAIGNGCTRRLPDSQSGRGRGAGVSLHQRGQRGSRPRGRGPGLGHLPDSEGASPASARPSTPPTPYPAQRTLGRRIRSRPGPAQDSKEENEPQRRRAGGENRHGVPPPVQGSFLPQAPPSVPELKVFIRVPESGTKNQRFLPEQK